MDEINDRLTAQANNDKYSLAIRAALGLAKKTLNRYYSHTDESEAYCISMSECISHLNIYFTNNVVRQ